MRMEGASGNASNSHNAARSIQDSPDSRRNSTNFLTRPCHNFNLDHSARTPSVPANSRCQYRTGDVYKPTLRRASTLEGTRCGGDTRAGFHRLERTLRKASLTGFGLLLTCEPPRDVYLQRAPLKVYVQPLSLRGRHMPARSQERWFVFGFRHSAFHCARFP